MTDMYNFTMSECSKQTADYCVQYHGDTHKASYWIHLG